MTRDHPLQHGVFLVTTNSDGSVPWLIEPGMRQILIDNLCMTRNVFGARLYAFCILPNHMHIVVNPGAKGISAFMQSFKSHTMVEIKLISPSGKPWLSAHENGYIGDKNITFKWQKSFHARLLPDHHALDRALHYVQYNASHHDLVSSSDQWPGTSLLYPDRIDSTEW